MSHVWQPQFEQFNQQAIQSTAPSAKVESTMLKFIVLVGLGGMFILLPVQVPTFGSNLMLVDLLNGVWLPVSWLYLIGIRRRVVRLPYSTAMWLILLGSFIGILGARNPAAGLIAIVKDTYLYVWFVTITAVMVSFNDQDIRPVLRVWLSVASIHAILIISQFVSPEIFQLTGAMASQFGTLDPSRPSGLFENANSAGLYQFMGFVPLLLLRLAKPVNLGIASLLFFSIVSTGSLGATGGGLIGLIVAIVALLAMGGGRKAIGNFIISICILILLVGGVWAIVLGENPQVATRVDYLLLDRARGSIEGRLSIWERGIEILDSDSFLWGIGPDNYRLKDLVTKSLHNDLLAFMIERGLIGTLGLVLLSVWVVRRAISLLKQRTRQDPSGAITVVFLAVITATLVHSQFHQIFHQRSVWLVLALMEAMLIGLEPGLDPRRALNVESLVSGIQPATRSRV